MTQIHPAQYNGKRGAIRLFVGRLGTISLLESHNAATKFWKSEIMKITLQLLKTACEKGSVSPKGVVPE
jgi:hypothetical protein